MSEIYAFVFYMACGGMISFKKKDLKFQKNFFILFY